MRKILLISLFCFFLYNSLAQSWGTIGTTWHTGIVESFFSTNQGYILSTIVADTIILTQPCKIVKSEKYYSTGQLAAIDTAFLYEENNIIHHYRSGQFYTLYDFNALPGDTWQISVPYPSPFTGVSGNSPDTIVTIVVDSVLTTLISGQIKKIFYVHSVNNDWFFANPIIEDIGSSGGLYPFIYLWMDIDIPYLRCYSDSLISYNVSPSYVCDTLINSINDDAFKRNYFSVYPNPVSDNIYILTYPNELKFYEVTVVDLYGQKWELQIFTDDNGLYQFDLSFLKRGFYLLILRSFKVHTSIKFIKL